LEAVAVQASDDDTLNLFLRCYGFEVLEDGSWQAGCFSIRWHGEKPVAAGVYSRATGTKFPVVTASIDPSPLESWTALGQKWAEEDGLVDGAAGSD
jgi:hypothetical protein